MNCQNSLTVSWHTLGLWNCTGGINTVLPEDTQSTCALLIIKVKRLPDLAFHEPRALWIALTLPTRWKSGSEPWAHSMTTPEVDLIMCHLSVYDAVFHPHCELAYPTVNPSTTRLPLLEPWPKTLYPLCPRSDESPLTSSSWQKKKSIYLKKKYLMCCNVLCENKSFFFFTAPLLWGA